MLEEIVHGKLAQDTESLNLPDDPDIMIEPERSWRDPSAAKLRSIVTSWSTGDPAPKEYPQVCLWMHGDDI